MFYVNIDMLFRELSHWPSNIAKESVWGWDIVENHWSGVQKEYREAYKGNSVHDVISDHNVSYS